jgi:SWI/SNF-related matrix-associated actin-dependent regulator of chromatin subfamily A member 5
MLLKKLKASGHKVLIFSQFKLGLNILQDYCVLRDWQYHRIDGDFDVEDRQESIMDFQSEESDAFIFLLSTRAGGMGITLTKADTVIIYDSDWNPQMDLQAIDRVHRIGQTNPVNIYRLVMENTVEEKIIEYQKIKLKKDFLFIEKGRAKYQDLSKVDDKLGLTKQMQKDLAGFGAVQVFNTIDGSSQSNSR